MIFTSTNVGFLLSGNQFSKQQWPVNLSLWDSEIISRYKIVACNKIITTNLQINPRHVALNRDQSIKGLSVKLLTDRIGNIDSTLSHNLHFHQKLLQNVKLQNFAGKCTIF